VEEPPPPAPEPAQPDQPDQPARRRAPTELPLPTGWVAVVLTGVVVGLVVVGLTWASLRTCEAVQGTATCGTAGYPMLALVVVVAILVGSAMLRLTHVPDPVSTSILGVGVASVLALVFLIDHLDQPAMVVVIPLICAATFAGSHWLTTAVIEPGDR
jgi:formate-dependent nitrite reductase membrane component NrfD